MSLKPVSQIFTANGTRYRIANASVTLGLDRTMGFSCTADLDANAGLPDLAPGMPFVFVQTCDGVQTYRGIIRQVTFQRGGNFTRWDVEGVGYSDAASHVRILRTFGPGGASDILAAAWAEFGPPGVALDISPGAPAIDQYESVYNSLMDLTNYIASSTGWSWTLDDGTFRFFNPMAREDGSATHMDFARGTLQAAYDMSGLFNVARQQAFQYLQVGYGVPGNRAQLFVPGRPVPKFGECYSTTWVTSPAYMSGLPFLQWELVSIEPSNIVVPGSEPKEVSFSLNDARTAVIASNPIVSGVFVVTFRRPVWAEARDGLSIAAYGKREAPNISGGGSDEVSEALRRLQTYVRERAYPIVTLSGEFNRSDIAPGMRILFDLPELRISRWLVVDQVSRATDNDDLQVRITCRAVVDRPGPVVGAATPRPDLAPEIFRRLDRLENAALSPATAAGAVWVDQNPIGASMAFQAAFSWGGAFEIEPLPDPEGIVIEEGEV